MRESLRRLRGPWRLNDPSSERSTGRKRRGTPACVSRRTTRKVSRIAVAAVAVFLLPGTLLAQSPWERAASNLEQTFTGPLARSLALVPVEEEEITPETAAALERARASLTRGEGVSHEEILREFGLKQ